MRPGQRMDTAVFGENFKEELSDDFSSVENTRTNISRVQERIKLFQERIRKHIEDNYVDFMPNHTTCDMYMDEGEALVHETEYLLKNVCNDTRLALSEANVELKKCVEELREDALGLQVSYRILKVDDLFQCVEEGNSTKDYLLVLELLSKLKSLICDEATTEADRVFQKCECYDTIKVQYHIQANILQQNLQQRFDQLVQLSEKSFPSAKNITLRISKDVNQLQATVMALFQARYNPTKICNFLLENCFVPLVLKPVSIEYSQENEEYVQLNISYSLKELSESLRPSYKQVFANIKILMECLANMNVNISSDHYVFSIIGERIKERFLALVVEECLIPAVPETMDDYYESTLIDDVLHFEQMLADNFFLNLKEDRALSEFTVKFPSYFRNRFSKKVLESAREIMKKDLQDMTTIAEGNSTEDVFDNPFLFPQCMVSKSTLELVKLLERILRQSTGSEGGGNDEADSYLRIISDILNLYVAEVPKLHEKLLESIPQQSALFYNNCMFLSHWVTKNSEMGIPAHPALVKILSTTGNHYFKAQVANQQRIIVQILREFDLSDTHSIGPSPQRHVRQCLRQMDLLKNVWQKVVPDKLYTRTFCDLLNDFCSNIIKRILALEDISATVATELSELLDIILDKVPSLFKEKNEVIGVQCWMKLQHLKMILNASLQEITEQWCDGVGILTATFTAEELRHMIRALFQNTDRRAKALLRII